MTLIAYSFHPHILKRKLTLSSLPAIFHLYLGHTALIVPQMCGIKAKEIFNARYGLMMLPAVASFTGTLAKGRKWRTILLGAALLIQHGYMFSTGDIVTLKDAKEGWNNRDARKIKGWLDKHYE